MSSGEEERKRSYDSLDARPVPCSELQASTRLADFDPQAIAWLEQHGVVIEDRGASILLHMPAGTTQQILYPFDMSARYRVRLPDGAEMTYVHARGHRTPHQIGVPDEAWTSQESEEDERT
jgi:hypothetical protein